jgi:hypothetical protein
MKQLLPQPLTTRSSTSAISKGNARGERAMCILWWGSMATPVGTPDLGAIVLPIPIPLLYLGSLRTILRKIKQFTDEEAGPLRLLTDGLIGKKSRIYGQDELSLSGLLDAWRALLRTPNAVLQEFLQRWPLLLMCVLCFCLYSGHVLPAEPTLTYLLSWRSCTATAHHLIPPHYKQQNGWIVSLIGASASAIRRIGSAWRFPTTLAARGLLRVAVHLTPDLWLLFYESQPMVKPCHAAGSY